MATGVYKRHSKRCASRDDGRRCGCSPTWQAQAYDGRTGKLATRSFPSEAAAKTWRHDTVTALRAGVATVRPRRSPTIADALDALVAGMRDRSVLDRSGKPYKPATTRSYDQAANAYLKPALGPMRLADVRRADVQKLVDRMRAPTKARPRGLSPSTVHNKLDPLRVVYRRAVRDDLVAVDPTVGLELPRVRGHRDRIAAPGRAEALLRALPDVERAMWATAFYAGLRVGELRALRWSDVDFAAGVIRVTRGWDDVEGEQEVKSDAARRAVPLIGRLRQDLAAHQLRGGRRGDDLVFGRTPRSAFVRTTVRRRALEAWKAANDRAHKEAASRGEKADVDELLEPLTPHEARHTCASYLIAAGLNPKQVQTYIGHSDVRTTFNVYGHLLPGDEAGAAAAMDAFLGPAPTLEAAR